MSAERHQRELAFLCEGLRASGRADDDVIARIKDAWAAQGEPPIRFLATLGGIDGTTARALEAVFKGYLRTPAGDLLAGFTTPATLIVTAPLPELASAPESEAIGALGPVPQWNSIEAAPTSASRALRSQTRAPRRRVTARVDAPAPGERLAGFSLREVLGVRGSATIYRAYGEALQRSVIVKLLQRDLGGAARERLHDEARRLARVDHPHVLRVLGSGEHQGAHYVVYEDVYAIGLDEHLEVAGVLEPPILVRVGLSAARGLAAALKVGVLHGDLSSACLRLYGPDGRVKVTDFGGAVDNDSLPADGVAAGHGTARGMAPEQVVGDAPADHRADMYSLGATLFELATGRPLFVRATALETMRAHLRDPAPAVEELRVGFPPTLSNLIARLVRKRPRDRFDGWDEVIAAFNAAARRHSNPIADAVTRAVQGESSALTSLYSRKVP